MAKRRISINLYSLYRKWYWIANDIVSICLPVIYWIKQDTQLMLFQTSSDSWVDEICWYTYLVASARDIPVYPICRCAYTQDVSCRSRWILPGINQRRVYYSYSSGPIGGLPSATRVTPSLETFFSEKNQKTPRYSGKARRKRYDTLQLALNTRWKCCLYPRPFKSLSRRTYVVTEHRSLRSAPLWGSARSRGLMSFSLRVRHGRSDVSTRRASEMSIRPRAIAESYVSEYARRYSAAAAAAGT